MTSLSHHFASEHDGLRATLTRLRSDVQQTLPGPIAEHLAQLQSEIRRHFRREEIFYRVLDNDKRVNDRGAMHQVRNDHAAIVFGLESLAIRFRKNGLNPDWAERLEKLLGILLAHFDHEEKRVYPGSLPLLSEAELAAIDSELSHDG